MGCEHGEIEVGLSDTAAAAVTVAGYVQPLSTRCSSARWPPPSRPPRKNGDGKAVAGSWHSRGRGRASSSPAAARAMR